MWASIFNIVLPKLNFFLVTTLVTVNILGLTGIYLADKQLTHMENELSAAEKIFRPVILIVIVDAHYLLFSRDEPNANVDDIIKITLNGRKCNLKGLRSQDYVHRNRSEIYFSSHLTPTEFRNLPKSEVFFSFSQKILSGQNLVYSSNDHHKSLLDFSPGPLLDFRAGNSTDTISIRLPDYGFLIFEDYYMVRDSMNLKIHPNDISLESIIKVDTIRWDTIKVVGDTTMKINPRKNH